MAVNLDLKISFNMRFIMPRPSLIRTNLYPYHVVSRSNHKLWFNLPMDEVWKIAIESISKALGKHSVKIHQFVLMYNHYHMILNTPNENIDLFMYELNKHFSLKLRMKTGLINRMFGGRYKWSLITNNMYAYNVYRYVAQNPIKAEIVNKCEEYPYSTLYFEANGLKLPFEIHSLFDNDYSLIKWININVSDQENLLINKGLKKTTFTIAKNRKTRKAFQLSKTNNS